MVMSEGLQVSRGGGAAAERRGAQGAKHKMMKNHKSQRSVK